MEQYGPASVYITGGIGSQSSGEAFTSDYDLPNDTVYAESCASIGLMMFARRMLEMEGDSQYADVMERALYNTVLGGMALDGKAFLLCESAGSTSKIAEIQPYLRSR